MYAPRNQVFQALLLIVGPFGATFVSHEILARVGPIEISFFPHFH